MRSMIIGTIGFCLYILYDINSIKWNNAFLKSGFLVGSLLIGAATIMDIVTAFSESAISGVIDWALILLAVAAFMLLIYCLFFALPFTDTYTNTKAGRRVCRSGVYALCRHPGWIPFFFMYLFLGAAALPHPLWLMGLLFSFWNLLYIVFQDRFTFPNYFSDYTDYSTQVPFLIPTKHSLREAIKTGKKAK